MNAMVELDRGQKAADILSNELYVETMAQLRTEIMERWQVEADQDKRDHLWRMIQTQKRFEALLAEALQTGKIRQKMIENEQTRAQKILGTFKRT